MDTPWGFSPPPVPVPVPVPKPVQVPRRVQGGTPLVSVGETHEYPMSFFFTAVHCNDLRPSNAANDISEFAREANPGQGWEPLHRAVKTVNPSARFARVLTALNRQREENRPMTDIEARRQRRARREAIAQRYSELGNQAEVAREFGISRERVRQLVERQRRIQGGSRV